MTQREQEQLEREKQIFRTARIADEDLERFEFELKCRVDSYLDNTLSKKSISQRRAVLRDAAAVLDAIVMRSQNVKFTPTLKLTTRTWQIRACRIADQILLEVRQEWPACECPAVVAATLAYRRCRRMGGTNDGLVIL